MKYTETPSQTDVYLLQVKERSDRLMNYFLAGYFILGIFLSFFYDTLAVALEISGLSLLAYYSTKKLFPDSDLYQYVLSAILGVFMAQYIYQMHGMFEMHFTAFIGSLMLISYQNWKLQIPIVTVVAVHHAVFGYLQFMGFDNVFFTQLEYMDIQTFAIHILLAAIIFGLSGLWAYQVRQSTETHIKQSFEIGRLQIAEIQKEELKKANMELDKFVYSVSHDLRAPLKSIAGIVEMTEDETQDEFVKDNMQMVKSSINKLDTFILDMLDYSRNARQQVKQEEIDFQSMLTDIGNNLKYMGDNNRTVDLSVSIHGDRPFVSDKSRINIILNNLTSNAIRYQNPEVHVPTVKISVDTNDDGAHIRIKDNGIGIKKEMHDRIFEMFYRVSADSIGSGLGLYIVKEAVEKLNGEIAVESEPGVGTEFTLLLPNMLYQ